jgi:hypothetical protein
MKKRSGDGRATHGKRPPAPVPATASPVRQLAPPGRRAHADGIVGILVRHRRLKAPR